MGNKSSSKQKSCERHLDFCKSSLHLILRSRLPTIVIEEIVLFCYPFWWEGIYRSNHATDVEYEELYNSSGKDVDHIHRLELKANFTFLWKYRFYDYYPGGGSDRQKFVVSGTFKLNKQKQKYKIVFNVNELIDGHEYPKRVEAVIYCNDNESVVCECSNASLLYTNNFTSIKPQFCSY
eukprot:154716_1